MKRKFLLYVPIVLIFIIILFLIVKYLNYSKNLEQNVIHESNGLTEERIKELIDESYKYYLLKEGNLNVSDEDIISVDGIIYSKVLLDGISNKNDIQKLVNDLITYDYSETRFEEVFSSERKFIEYDNKLYVYIGETTCELNYRLDDKKYEIIKGDDLQLKFILDEMHEYIFSIYNNENDYKIISSFYSCSKNIR